VARANEFWRARQRKVHQKCIWKWWVDVTPILKANEELLRAFFLLIVSPSHSPPPTTIPHYISLLISHHLPSLTASFCIDFWACADPRIGSAPITPAMPHEISSCPDLWPDCAKNVKLNVNGLFFYVELLSHILVQCDYVSFLCWLPKIGFWFPASDWFWFHLFSFWFNTWCQNNLSCTALVVLGFFNSPKRSQN